jgi:hypothetical protein
MEANPKTGLGTAIVPVIAPDALAVVTAVDGGELLDEAAGDRGSKERIAGADHENRGGEVRGGDVLEQETAGSGGVQVPIEARL